MKAKLAQGECIEVMGRLPADSIDAIVTDPPYGLEFMGKEWDDLGGDASAVLDTGLGHRETPWVGYGKDAFGGANPTCAACGGRRRGKRLCDCAEPQWKVNGMDRAPATPASLGRAQQDFHHKWAAEAFRVLKPGGYLLAFGGSRTYHRLAVGVEDAGFEIRDTIAWMYGQGFPKSHNLRGERAGWGTALKPGMEPIVVARKPLVGTVAANVERFGTGALNIDGCRVGTEGGTTRAAGSNVGKARNVLHGGNFGVVPIADGRWPANVVLSHIPEDDETPGCRIVGHHKVRRDVIDAAAKVNDSDGWGSMQGSKRVGTTTEEIPIWECAPGCPVAALDAQTGTDDEDGASRFFYQSKATNAERWGYCHTCDVVFNRGDKAARAAHPTTGEHAHRVEYHPTVKPVALMRWLVRLVTPPGGIVLDPFAGTGTTGEAALAEGFRFEGIERELTYFTIAQVRLGGHHRG